MPVRTFRSLGLLRAGRGIVLGIGAFTATSAASAGGNVTLPRYPAISPDGEAIVFSWRGDLWKVSSQGGTAFRLTSHPGNELRAAWSRDGKQIAFNSDRNGYDNIYLMNADGTDIRQVTHIDRPCTLTGFGVDQNGNEVILFDSQLEGDIYRDDRPYMVSVVGGDLLRIHDAFGGHPVMSADGERIAFTRGGVYDGWVRRHYRGPDNINIWLYNRTDDSFAQLTEFNGTDGKPRWGGDRTILFLSDREDRCMNLYRMSAAEGEQTIARLTDYTENDVYEFDVAANGSVAVLSVWDALYTLDLNDPNARPRELTINAAEDERDNYERRNIGREVSEAALSPDGKVMAVVAYGEVYVRNIDEGSPTRRVTNDHARERDIAWSPDGLKLYFTSDRNGRDAIFAATVKMTRGEVRESFEEKTGVELTLPDLIKDKPDENESKSTKTADEPDATPGDPISGQWTGTADHPVEGAIAFTMTLTLEADGSVTGNVDAGTFSGTVGGAWDAAASTLNLTIDAGEAGQVECAFNVEADTLTGTATAGDVQLQITATRITETDAPNDSGTNTEPAEKNGDKKKPDKKDLPKELKPERWQDAMTFTIEPVVQRDNSVRSPNPSPDGKKLSFRSTRGAVHILDYESGDEITLLDSWDAWTTWRWSPDSRLIAYAQSDLNFNRDIFIVPAGGSTEPINISRHPDNDENPVWSADGRILSFTSERINEEYDVWMVYLDKELESLTPLELKTYYENAEKAAKKRKPLAIDPPDPPDAPDGDDEDDSDAATDNAEGDNADDDAAENADEDADDESEDEDVAPPLELELDDAYLRVKRITSLTGDETGNHMTPAGDRLIFNAGGDESGLFSVKWDGSDRKRLAGRASVQHVSLTGDKVVLVMGGQAATVSPTGGSVETVSIDDRIRIDLAEQSRQKFLEAARTLGEQFYHPTMNALDWDALKEKYLPLASAAHTADEFNYVANRFIGETSGSHLGVRASDPTSPNRESNGRLGTVHHRVADGFAVTHVIKDSPAALGPMAIRIGDEITAINFEPIGDGDTIEMMLEGKIGEETVITVNRTNETGETVELNLLITPISFGQQRALQYLEWRERNAQLVNDWSGGRLGYIHIQGMNQPSLDVFERDLFAAADGMDGLVLDVRNNGGGWTTDRVLSSIMVQPHAYTVPRGADWDQTGHYPQDRLFIQRYSMPMNLLCNEKSYSNAEIMSHAFKTLKRGTLVGQQTHGSVISTGGFALIDGAFVRLPFRGWFVVPASGVGRGTDMELNGAIPDLIVPQTPEAETRGEDEQLRAAVEDLMTRIDQ